jgi:Secretion system C-terminal sorting domain
MNQFRFHIYAIVLATMFHGAFATEVKSQAPLTVWPGDANNNGVVNSVDFLYLGLGYNYVGPARAQASPSFVGQAADLWSFGLGAASTGGFNFAYTDCNGDGLINYTYDAFPIYVHYGLTHGTVTADLYPQGIVGIDPQINFNLAAQDSVVNPGEAISLPIHLGDANLPIENFYGIAFSIHTDSNWVNLDSAFVSAAPAGTWINNDGDRVTSVYRVGNQKLDIAITRTDHNERNGHGNIGRFDFIIIDDVISVSSQMRIIIDSIYLTDELGNTTAIAGDTVTFVVESPTASQPEPSPEKPVIVYPNPATDYLCIASNTNVRHLSLLDWTGRSILTKTLDAESVRLALPKLQAGVYLLDIQTDTGWYRKKIIIK